MLHNIVVNEELAKMVRDPSLPEGVSLNLDPEKQARLAHLQEVFLDISETPDSGSINTHSMQYVQHGDGLRRCLNEIIELRGPSAEDLSLNDLRQAYIETLFIKSGLLTPSQRKAYDTHSDDLQQHYTGRR